MSETFIFLVFAYLAAIFATLAGFGSSTVLMPVSLMFMEFKTAIFFVSAFHLFNNLFKVQLFFKKLDYKLIGLFGVPSVLLTFLGANLIDVIPVDQIKRILAVFLILYGASILGQASFVIKPTKHNAILGGILSGFFAGLIGLGGAIRGMFLVTFNLPKEVYIATSAFIAFIIDITRVPTYFLLDFVTDKSDYILIPYLILIAYLGVRTGKMLLKHVSHEKFKKIVAVGLILAGLKFVF